MRQGGAASSFSHALDPVIVTRHNWTPIDEKKRFADHIPQDDLLSPAVCADAADDPGAGPDRAGRKMHRQARCRMERADCWMLHGDRIWQICRKRSCESLRFSWQRL